MLRCASWIRTFKAGCTSRFAQGGRYLVLSAHHFNDLLYDVPATTGTEAFRDNPLKGLQPAERGMVLAKLARRIDVDIHPTSKFEDPAASKCTDGSQRGAHRSEYDWRRDGLRIECKSSQMQWLPSLRSWQFVFGAVKFAHQAGREVAAFDELVLVLLDPHNLHFYVHDGALGVSTVGLERTRAAGHQIVIRGPRGEEDWKKASVKILRKLDCGSNSCRRVAMMECTDPRVSKVLESSVSSLRKDIYADSPLSVVSSAARGLRIESLVRRVDAILHGGSVITDPDACSDRTNRARYDWKRNDRRIECKSSSLLWDRSGERWKLAFAGIKLAECSDGGKACFDELFISVYTPKGVYVYRHDLVLGMSRLGQNTKWRGYQVQLYAPSKLFEWQAALDVLLLKLEDSGCQRIAWIRW
ncbi:unnamed protein product [Prorocentrum cordatum]|uniref:Decapping nuclease n=1 Tax=Prorocentrum cordatum TaxID=2364126 RepID=A0ABN9S3T3_9DINO|nr:unnamed protein product [Polarella glacialis]